jgi:hypothetical protein
MKITPPNINTGNKVLIHSLLYVERKRFLRWGLVGTKRYNLIDAYNT